MTHPVPPPMPPGIGNVARTPQPALYHAPEDGWRERAIVAVAMMLQSIHDGEWTPEDTDGGDVAMAIARKAVALTEAKLLETYRPC